LNMERVIRDVGQAEIRRTIYVRNKLLNLVV
jgi:hypothetical protein